MWSCWVPSQFCRQQQLLQFTLCSRKKVFVNEPGFLNSTAKKQPSHVGVKHKVWADEQSRKPNSRQGGRGIRNKEAGDGCSSGTLLPGSNVGFPYPCGILGSRISKSDASDPSFTDFAGVLTPRRYKHTRIPSREIHKRKSTIKCTKASQQIFRTEHVCTRVAQYTRPL